MKKILFLRPDAIGDCLIGASMIAPIKDHYKNASITVLCQALSAEIFANNPAVNDVIILNRKKLQDEAYRSELLATLKEREFDLVLNPLYSRELILDDFACKIGAKEVVGFKVVRRRGRWDFPFRYNRGYSKYVVLEDDFLPELEKYQLFLSSLGIASVAPLQPQMFTTPADEAWAEAFCQQPEVRAKKIVILFSGANSFHRTYNFYGDALRLAFGDSKDVIVVAFGSQADFQINQENCSRSGMPFINLAGKTTLSQAAALMKRAYIGFGAETGLAHLACAVRLPHVVLLGGGHYGRFMPYSPYTSVVMRPMSCFKCNWKCKYPEAYCVKLIRAKAFVEALLNAREITDQPRIYRDTTT